MEEKDTPPVKRRKLKKIDEYREVVPRAWKIYQHELAKGIDPRKAELRAVKKAQRNGMDLEEVLDFSRHKDVRTLMIYRDRERNVQGKLSELVAETV